jgi:NAD(P)-dependent dehydrogenase (short-subunit alcohol dehydrogenase family)
MSPAHLFSTDPELVAKVTDVVGLYLDPPENAVVFCASTKIPDPDPRPHPADAADATRPSLAAHPRLRSPWHHDPCSIRGVVGGALSAEYNVSKAGLDALTKTAASQWGQFGIRANAIRPVAASDSYRRYREQNPEVSAARDAVMPLRHIGDPEDEVAGAFLFLATDDSKYLTGTTIDVDDGLHLTRSGIAESLVSYR